MACSLSELITYRSSDDSDSLVEVQKIEPQRESAPYGGHSPCEKRHLEEPSGKERERGGEGAGESEAGQAQKGEQPEGAEAALPTNPVSPLRSPYAKRMAYAAELTDLSEQMWRFLGEVKHFFMQKIDFKRQRIALSASTYGKAQERMLCKFPVGLDVNDFLL